MISRRKMRRISGWITSYISDDLLQHAAESDGRSVQGRTWKSALPLFKAVLLGLLAGCKQPKDVEKLTAELPLGVRRRLGIPRRIPDTTLRDFLCKIDNSKLYELVYIVGYDAWRRKALRQREDIAFPIGVISADGKYPSISDTGSYEYLQVHHDNDTGEATHGLVRTVTSVLMTAQGRPILGCYPINGSTNEQGSFQEAFEDMVRIYGNLFQVVMYDAGAASESNADAVVNAGKDYVFLIADPRWVMVQTTEMLFQDKNPVFVEEEKVSQHERVIRKLSIISLTPKTKNTIFWKHTRTLFRLQSEFYRNDTLTGSRTRYAVSSMTSHVLSAEQWYRMHVLRWDVESAHGVLDTTFEEDKRPWIRTNAQGHLAVQILRRVAYTLLALYKYVTLRSEEDSAAPWRCHMEWLKDVLKWVDCDILKGLRTRTYAVPPALI